MLFLKLALQTFRRLVTPEWLMWRLFARRTEGLNDPKWTIDRSVATVVAILEECDRQCASVVGTLAGRPDAIREARNCFRIDAMEFIMDHSVFLRAKCRRSDDRYGFSRALFAIVLVQYTDNSNLAWRAYFGQTWLDPLERQLKQRLTAIGQLLRQHQLTSQWFEYIPY